MSVSPLLLNRLKEKYPHGVNASNLADIIADVATYKLRYKANISERDLTRETHEVVSTLENNLDNWFMVYVAHSICSILLKVRNRDIHVRKRSKWNCLAP